MASGAAPHDGNGPSAEFDHEAFEHSRGEWDRETLPGRCNERAAGWLAAMFDADDDDEAFEAFRNAVRLVVSAMNVEDGRAEQSRRTAWRPRSSPPLTPEQDAFYAAALERPDGHTVYWPLRRAGIDTFPKVVALTEAEVLRINEVGPKRVAILRAILERHGYRLHDE